MATGQYRIIQTSDTDFAVEELHIVQPAYFWPWNRKPATQEWERARFCGGPLAPTVPAFKSESAAQKWVDDKRKYPLVVKEPA